MRCDVKAIWHPTSLIFQDFASYSWAWIVWNRTQVVLLQVQQGDVYQKTGTLTWWECYGSHLTNCLYRTAPPHKQLLELKAERSCDVPLKGRKILWGCIGIRWMLDKLLHIQSSCGCRGREKWVVNLHQGLHVAIVRSCGPIFGVHASVQSHFTNLRVRRIATTAEEWP